MSKRDASMSIDSVRDSGVTSDALVGYLGWTLGWIPQPDSMSAKDLVQYFDWRSMSQQSDWILHENFIKSYLTNVTLNKCKAS